MLAKVPIKGTLFGALTGAIIGIVILLCRQRKILKTGLFVQFKFLQFHPHLIGLLRKVTPHFKQTRFSVKQDFKTLVTEFDQVVKALIDFQTGVPTCADKVLSRLLMIRNILNADAYQKIDLGDLKIIEYDMFRYVSACNSV
jgi:hypothetical protein